MSHADASPFDRRAPVHDDPQPATGRNRGGLPVHDAELEPEAARTGGHRLVGVRHAERGLPKDVHEVERPGRLRGRGQCRIGRDSQDLPFIWVDRHAIEAAAQEEAEDVERRSPLVGRSTDDGDPASRQERSLDRGVIEQWDRSTVLRQVEEGDRSLALLSPPGSVVRQVAPSLT